MSHRTEKFSMIIERLATSQDSIQERLLNAVYENPFLDNDFPEEDLREEFMDIKNESENIKLMSSDAASALASELIS